VDSFSRFSRLLDANYDAMHGSFASVVRLLEHMGRLNFEVMTVLKTFAIFRIAQSVLSRTFGVFSFLLPWRYLSSSSSSSSSSQPDKGLLDIRDFQNFAKSSPNSPSNALTSSQSPPSWRTLLVVFILTFVGLPMAASKLFSLLKTNRLENEWVKERVIALHDFRGETNHRELSFNKGEVLVVTNKGIDPDWWEASLHGQVGLIPSNYVAPCNEGDEIQPHYDERKLITQ